MRSSGWNALRLLSTLLSVVLLGTWVNLFTDRLDGDDYVRTLVRLKWSNLLLIGGAVFLIGGEFAAKRRRLMERRDLERRLDLLRQRQHRLLKSTLAIVCELISKTLRIPCNGRYFIAVPDNGGEIYLEQDRDLAALNVRMPREFGFTRVSVNTPHIVTGRSFRDRCPIYEDLPVDHHSQYDARVARMIEPSQRWVLACPVLTLDPETNRHDEATLPNGVICFYGVDDPPATGKKARVDACLDYAEQFADQLSQLLNMIELTRGMADINEPTAKGVP